MFGTIHHNDNDNGNNNNNNNNKFCFFFDDHQPLTSICERLVNRQRADIRVVAVILQNETVNVEERKLPITMKDSGQIFEATVFVVKGWESFVELKNILMRD